jgi:hypothetical protein
MTTQLLNRSLLATLIGATLALGGAGVSHAQDPNARMAERADREETQEERQARRKAQQDAAQVQAEANVRADRARAAADANARVHNDRAELQRAQMEARVEAARHDREQARAEGQRERAMAEARADRQRQQAEARAQAQADRNARVTPRPSDRAIERSPTHRDIRPVEGTPYGQIVSEQRHRRNEARQEAHHEDRNRRDDLRDVRERREAIAREQAREQAYRQYLAERQQLSRQRAYDLQRANRLAQYRYQQQYYDRMRQMRLRDSRYDWYSDPFFSSRPTYGYYRGGSYYQVNRYAADMLRDAVRLGYQEGVYAGRADRMDGWRPSYRDSFVYQDANYGYRGYYVDRREYAHYFREGFRRGYEDGYYGQSRYGRSYNGRNSILETVLALVLNFRNL